MITDMKKRTIILAGIFLMLSAWAVQVQGKADGRLRVAFVGDPQVDNIMELDYARRSVYRELRERTDIDMAIFLGDIVNDSMELLEPSRASLDSLPFPWSVIPGNHDYDVYRGRKAIVKQPGRDRDLASYTRVFGSPDTTFVRGGIRFILMDDMIYEGNGYLGGFDDRQVEYLDSVVSSSQGERLLVLATHIPYSHIKERAVSDSILAVFPGEILLVSGHTHRVGRSSAVLAGGRKVPELVAGASCGSWWRGKKDEHGIPYALQGCGAPRGYFIADFRMDGYSLGYKCIGKDADCRASAWTAKVGIDSTKLVVNVFGGSLEGKVEVRAKGLAGGRWTGLEMKGEVAPEVLEAIADRDTMTKEERRERKDEMIPLTRSRSPHVWSVTVPGDICPRHLKIRYNDPHMSFRDMLPCRSLLPDIPDGRR